MPKGVLLVESRPSSPDRLDEFNKWYEEVHIPEVLALEGFVSARRLRPLDGDGPIVTIYDVDGEDLGAVASGLSSAARNGAFTWSDSMQMDPPPAMRFLEETPER
ncbi:DUF4286 family protein [Gordonia rhizosphera]|uniref:EthD domain-containing protein n=1 Tax=Gordonia rhizosphera NBRC 16068 TaxID=1108045 RepID=K6WBY7_9ACTN|nr:DUF4286 family protein [Gordonia rhizosphera]GAB89707.1 hypothetical protein GORHZ_069_00860 [Gordonia rhizosphera NBRC 16068]